MKFFKIPTKDEAVNATAMAVGFIAAEYVGGKLEGYMPEKVPAKDVISKFVIAIVLGALPVPKANYVFMGALMCVVLGILKTFVLKGM